MAHWLTSYIGKPYLLGASGPNAFDCWGFVRWVLIHHYDYPMSEVKDSSALSNPLSSTGWHPLDCPHDGAVVMMEASNCPHVGVWVEADYGGVAHCIEAHGVVFTPLSILPAIGCRLIAFYRFSQNLQ